MYKYLLIVACAMGLSAKMVGGVAVVVNDKAITLYDIQKEMKTGNIDEVRATSILVRQKLEEHEIVKRGIKVSSSDIYEDIKQTAQRNNMTVSEFYQAALNSNGLDSDDLKEKIKRKILSQRLYDKISYPKISQPTESEMKVYYELNKEKFNHPASFSVVIYQTDNKQALMQKVQNPMFYSPQIQTQEQVLPYKRIAPQLAALLARTPINAFSKIVPDGKGGHMSFYVKSVEGSESAGYEDYKDGITRMLIASKREQILRDHFTRLKDNSNIKVLRSLN